MSSSQEDIVVEDDCKDVNIRENLVYNMDCLKYLDPPYYNVVDETWDNLWSSMSEYLVWLERIIGQVSLVSKHNCSLW